MFVLSLATFQILPLKEYKMRINNNIKSNYRILKYLESFLMKPDTKLLIILADTHQGKRQTGNKYFKDLFMTNCRLIKAIS